MIQKNIFVKTFIDDSFQLTRMFAGIWRQNCIRCDLAIIKPTGISIDPSEQNIECILNDARRQTTEINNIVMNSLLTGEPHLEEGLLNVQKLITWYILVFFRETWCTNTSTTNIKICCPKTWISCTKTCSSCTKTCSTRICSTKTCSTKTCSTKTFSTFTSSSIRTWPRYDNSWWWWFYWRWCNKIFMFATDWLLCYKNLLHYINVSFMLVWKNQNKKTFKTKKRHSRCEKIASRFFWSICWYFIHNFWFV